MDAYFEDEHIEKFLYAAMYNSEKLLERIHPEEILEIDVNIAWTVGRTILADKRIPKKDRLKLSMSVAKGAMIIRDQKLKLLHKKLKTFVKSMEHIDIQARIDSEDPEVARTVSKLVKDLDTLGVPDIDLHFEEYPLDRHLLPEVEEEVLFHSSKYSGTLEHGTLSFRDFDKDCKQQHDVEQVPEREQLQIEQEEGEQQVPGEDIQVRKSKQQVPREEQQVPELVAKEDVNMEVDQSFALPGEIPGTPSKRPGSLIRGDDTPSKRGRFSSLIPAAEKEPEVEEFISLGISGIQPLDGPGRVVSPQLQAGQEQQLPEVGPTEPQAGQEEPLPEARQEQELPEARQEEQLLPGTRQEEEPEVKEPIQSPPRPRQRGGRKRGLRDERTTLTDRWFEDFPKRTEWYTKPSTIDVLRAEISTQPLAPKVLLKMPGFTIRNAKLRGLFEDNFVEDVLLNVELLDQGDDISPEGSLPLPEGEPRNEEAEQEQPRHAPEISNLMESFPEGEEVSNVNKTVESRKSMGRVSIHSPAITVSVDIVDETRAIPPEPPRLSVEALGMEDTFADNLPGDQFQQDVPQRAEIGPPGITEETMLTKILDRLTLGDRDYVTLEEIIPPESENTETAAWSFSCVLVLKKKRKIMLSQDGSKEPIYIRRFIEDE